MDFCKLMYVLKCCFLFQHQLFVKQGDLTFFQVLMCLLSVKAFPI